MHLAAAHGQQNASDHQRIIVSTGNAVTADLGSIVYATPAGSHVVTSGHQEEIYVPINAVQSPLNITNISGQQTQTLVTEDEGQQIIQQFQIQLPDQSQLVGQSSQPIQVIQTDPNNPGQPQVITLYTWGGN